MDPQVGKDWFKDWFDSPYYPILYDHRNAEEANNFIHCLGKKINFRKSQKALDLACGSGRHSIQLFNEGLDVLGMDLSPASIQKAKENEQPGLNFICGDMRDPFPGKYDFIFNLFTSFGYFETLDENKKVLQNVCSALNPGGIFVLDYFNAENVVDCMQRKFSIEKGGIHFDIAKEIRDGKIVKNIKFKDQGKDFEFCEVVSLYYSGDLEKLLNESGLIPQIKLGTYQCGVFDEKDSPRIIFICSKRDN